MAAGKGHKPVDAGRVPVLIRGEGVENLSSALRVAHQGDLGLASHLSDLVHHGWYVIFAHISPAEVPVLPQTFLPFLIIASFNVAIESTPIVTHPDIVASLGKFAGERRAEPIQEPTSTRNLAF